MKKNIHKRVAVLLVLLLAFTALLSGCASGSSGGEQPVEKPESKLALVQAQFPEQVRDPMADSKDGSDIDWDQYEAWSDDLYKRMEAQQKNGAGAQAFAADTMPLFLIGDGENRAYSPLNVYFALALLADIASGDSQAQILTALHADSLADLQEKAPALWQACYRDDGQSKNILGNSLWLSDEWEFNEKLLQQAGERYFADAYRGKMGSQEINDLFHEWLDKMTGGLLTEQIEALKLDPDIVMALASTIYYKAGWEESFPAEETKDDTFHAESGDETVPFMHMTESGTLFTGTHFTAVMKRLSDGGRMLLMLPAEGYTPEDLMEDPQAVAFLAGDLEQAGYESGDLVLSIPKFDVTGEFDLIGYLRDLGITDVFSPDAADFSELSEKRIYVSKAQHDARVKIDEEGVEAAAFTVMMMEAAGAWEPHYIEFTLDRPFLFSVNSGAGIPLFTGVVHHPAA